jgi:hypothetical protein
VLEDGRSPGGRDHRAAGRLPDRGRRRTEICTA